MVHKSKKQLKIFITQGKAYENLLHRVNDGGRYEKRIREIQKKLSLAEKKLYS